MRTHRVVHGIGWFMGSSLAGLVLLACLDGCGLVAYERLGARDDGGSADAATDASTSDASMDAGVNDGSTSTLPLHWWRFDGTGTVAVDSAGSANGMVMGGATLTGTGSLALAGTTPEQYVNLPNGMISSLVDATIEAWIIWNGSTGQWQRVFDFGNSSGGEDVQGAGTRHFSLAVDRGDLRLVFDVDPSLGSNGWRAMWFPGALPSGSLHQVVATFDSSPSPSRIALYLDGVLLGATDVPDTESLSLVDDVNCWLGRAQWDQDAEFDGQLNDVRIYGRAMTATEIAGRFTRGPDAP